MTTASNSEARKRLAASVDSLAGYFVAADARDVPTIWRGDRDDAAPVAVLNRHDLRECPGLWDALVRCVEGER